MNDSNMSDRPEMDEDNDQTDWDRLREEEERRDWLQGDQPASGEEELT